MTVTIEGNATICGHPGYRTSQENYYLVFYPESSQPSLITEEDIRDISVYKIDDTDILKNRMTTMILGLTLKLQSDFVATIRSICKTKEESLKNYLSMLGQGHGKSAGKLSNMTDGVEIMNFGAVSYLVSGQMMAVSVHHHNTCYEELPITIPYAANNETEVFMDPRTMIIRPYCTQRVCDPIFPYYYYVKLRNNSDIGGTPTFLCTTGTPHLGPCETPPLKIEAMAGPLDLQISRMIYTPMNSTRWCGSSIIWLNYSREQPPRGHQSGR